MDTNSDVWNSASPETSTKTEILNFLKENPNRAFTAEEISREVLNADFEIDIPEQELPIEEMLGRAISSTQFSAYTEGFVKSHISALVYEGKVEVRLISTEIGGEEADIGHYTIRD